MRKQSLTDGDEAYVAAPGLVASTSLPVRSLSDVDLLAEIGRGLRVVYSELLRQPLPDHLAVVLEKLEAQNPDHRRT